MFQIIAAGKFYLVQPPHVINRETEAQRREVSKLSVPLKLQSHLSILFAASSKEEPLIQNLIFLTMQPHF